MNKPTWVKEYEDFGFSENWLDSVIEKHNEDIFEQLGEKSNPLYFYKIEPLNIENNSEFISNLTIPCGYTISEVLLFILDCLNCVGKNCPNNDSEIYDLYNHLTIINDISFSEFYVFIRKLKHIDIEKIQEYKLLNETVKYYTLKTVPLKNSKWIVSYKDTDIEVKVKKECNYSNQKVYDEKIPVKITNIIDENKPTDIEEGLNVELKPHAFNNGKQIQTQI